MSNRERTGWRDSAYSEWHRGLHPRLSFLDLDWIERCDECKEPVAVYELRAFIDDTPKAYFTTRRVANALRIPGFVVLYEVENGVPTRFRVRRITEPQSAFKDVTPAVWARQLKAFRVCHPITEERPAGQNPDGTWGEMGWFTEALYREWG